MDLELVGLNHRRAPVEVREALAFRREEVSGALEELRRRLPGAEGVLLSTCNRVEFTLACAAGAFRLESFVEALRAMRPGAPEAAWPRLYHHRGPDAVRHLLRVSSGLDSMVMGETQVLGQMKQAYAAAHDGGHTGPVLNRVFQSVFRAAKRIRSLTQMGPRELSVPGVAARLAARVFENLGSRRGLLIGAGETAELAAVALKHRGMRTIHVANRSRPKAEELAARFGGEAFGLEDLPAALARADLVLCCVEADRAVLDAAQVKAAMRTRPGESLLVLDLGVPRNVQPETGNLPDLYLFDMDDLQEMVERATADHGEEIARCEAIVEEETAAVANSLRATGAGSVIAGLQAMAAEICDREASLVDDGRREEARRVAERALNKFLHGPISVLREGEGDAGIQEAARRLFGLPDGGGGSGE